MSELLKWREERSKLIHEARSLNDEKRGVFDTETQKRYDTMINRVTELKEMIDREERLFSLESEVRGTESPVDVRGNSAPFKAETRRVNDALNDKRFAHLPQIANASQYGDDFRTWLTGGEARNLTAGSDTQGGYLTASVQMVDGLLKNLDNAVVMRRLGATSYSVPNAQSLGIPTLENDPDDADWTGENTAITLDTTMSFGSRSLYPHMLQKGIKVSRRLLQLTPSAERIVNDRFSYKFGVTEEKAFLTGTGVNQPLGVFTASNNGVPTSRDVSTGNTTTAIGADNLRTVKYTLKSQYMANAVWLFHRDAVSAISKLKDSQNQYLWQEGLRQGDPDTLLGMPVYTSEYAPNTFTTGQYVGLLFVPSFYWIADSLTMEAQRLVEKYADTNEIGYYWRKWTDGAPVLAEAFVRVTLA